MKKPITEFKLESRSKRQLWSLLNEHIYFLDRRGDISRQELIDLIKHVREKIKEREE
jgi:UDP-N-acetylenolpyruvoylglucosamine reductase